MKMKNLIARILSHIGATHRCEAAYSFKTALLDKPIVGYCRKAATKQCNGKWLCERDDFAHAEIKYD